MKMSFFKVGDKVFYQDRDENVSTGAYIVSEVCGDLVTLHRFNKSGELINEIEVLEDEIDHIDLTDSDYEATFEQKIVR